MLGLGDLTSAVAVAHTPRRPVSTLIDDTLRRYPKLRATRLYDMLRERGYPGSVRTLRGFVATVRHDRGASRTC